MNSLTLRCKTRENTRIIALSTCENVYNQSYEYFPYFLFLGMAERHYFRSVNKGYYTIKRLNITGWIGLILFLVTACGPEELLYQTQVVEDIYQMDIPTAFSPQENLSKNAQVQLGNPSENVYLAMHHTAKEALHTPAQDWNLDSLYHFHKENVILSIDRVKSWVPDTLSQGGMRGLMGQIKGKYEGQSISYQLGVWEGTTHYYQVLIWYPQAKAERWQAASQQMIHSLKEIEIEGDTSDMTQGDDGIDSSGLPSRIEP